MSRRNSQSTFSVYRRLLGFTRPYLPRLGIGLLAGLLGGGSVFGLLKASPQIIKPFEAPPAVAQTEDDGGDQPGPDEGQADALQRTARRFGVTPVREDGTMTWQFMALSLLAIPLLVFVRALAGYLNRYCLRWVGARVVRDMRDALFAHLQNQSLSHFGRTDVGQMISRCTNDTSMVEHLVSSTVADATRAPFEILAATVFVVVFALQYGLMGMVMFLFLAFPLCVVPIIVLGRYVRRHTRRALERVSTLVSRMHENFTGIRVVKAFHMEAKETERFRGMNARYFRSVIKALRAELLMTPLMEAVALVLGCAFFTFCYARGVKLFQIVPIGFAAVVAYRPIKQLARINASVQRGAAALDRIFHILDTDTRLAESPTPRRMERFSDRAVFEQVSFRYGDEGPDVVTAASFELRKGSVVALVGETGSGKTTLANLLARFYDPTRGRVTLDGVDLRDIETASLRRSQSRVVFGSECAAICCACSSLASGFSR